MVFCHLEEQDREVWIRKETFFCELAEPIAGTLHDLNFFLGLAVPAVGDGVYVLAYLDSSVNFLDSTLLSVILQVVEEKGGLFSDRFVRRVVGLAFADCAGLFEVLNIKSFSVEVFKHSEHGPLFFDQSL